MFEVHWSFVIFWLKPTSFSSPFLSLPCSFHFHFDIVWSERLFSLPFLSFCSPLSPLILWIGRCSVCVWGWCQTGNRRPPAAAPPIWLHSPLPPPSLLYTPRPITQCGNNNSQTKLWGLPLHLLLLSFSLAASLLLSVLSCLESLKTLLSLTSTVWGVYTCVCVFVSVWALSQLRCVFKCVCLLVCVDVCVMMDPVSSPLLTAPSGFPWGLQACSPTVCWRGAKRGSVPVYVCICACVCLRGVKGWEEWARQLRWGNRKPK